MSDGIEGKNTLEDVGCYVTNVGELMTAIGDGFVTEDNKVVVKFPDGVKTLIQTLIDKVDETLQECEGKELVFDVPEGVVGETVKFAVKALGFNVKFK
jgi:hypothetical protein